MDANVTLLDGSTKVLPVSEITWDGFGDRKVRSGEFRARDGRSILAVKRTGNRWVQVEESPDPRGC